MTLLFNHTAISLAARNLCARLLLACVLMLPLFLTPALRGHAPVMAQAAPGTIAYVRPELAAGDQIRLVEPDGSRDRLIWRTGVPGNEGLEQIYSLAWNPAASALAFASRHEDACSLYTSDIYTIRADGSNYRRFTAPPACGQTAGLPTGTVIINVANYTYETGPFIVYFQGAPAPQAITLAPGFATTLTFTNVVDFGNFNQWAAASFGIEHFIAAEADADVLPGKTVTAGTLYMGASYGNWGWTWPSWTSDGSALGYIFNAMTPYWMDADNTAPGMIGSQAFNVPLDQFPYDPMFLSWAPAGPRAGQVLYAAWDNLYEDQWVFLGTPGSNSPGEALFPVNDNMGHIILGLAWLPDSSGFLFSKMGGFNEYANIYKYTFATQATTQLTGFTSGYTRQLSVSPDGARVVYEYQATGDATDIYAQYDLWMLNLNTGTSTPFVENGRSPAWSPGALPPAGSQHKFFVPGIIKK